MYKIGNGIIFSFFTGWQLKISSFLEILNINFGTLILWILLEDWEEKPVMVPRKREALMEKRKM